MDIRSTNLCRFMAAACLGMFASTAVAQTTITQWNFNDTGQSTTSPPPSVGIGTASLRGTTATYSSASATGGSSDTTVTGNSGWNTTNYPAQSVESGQRGVQFAASTVGFDNIIISYDCRFSSSCSRYTEVLYSIDGVNFLPGSPRLIFAAGDGTVGDQWINNRQINLSSVPGVANNPNFAFRVVTLFNPNPWVMVPAPNTPFAANTAYQPKLDTASYGTGGGGGGTNRYDMVTIAGDARAFSPISAAVSLSPAFACGLTSTPITINAVVSPGQNPVSSGITVTANLVSVGGSAAEPFTSIDGVNFTLNHNVPASFGAGNYSIAITTSDAQNRQAVVNRTLALVDCSANANSAVVISQIYGGGGSLGPPEGIYNADFIEILNRSNADVNLDGWSLQYIDATNSAGFDDASNVVPLSGIIKPGQYRLARFSVPGGPGQSLPFVDFVRTSPSGGLSASAGRVALVDNTTLLGVNCGSSSVKDLVGYAPTAVCFEGAGATAAPATDTAVIRKLAGNQDANQNFSDFVIGTPTPRNRAFGGNLAGFASGNVTQICNGDTYTLSVQVVAGEAPTSTLIGVTANLSAIGGSTNQSLTDNGGGIFSFSLPVAASQGNKTITVTTVDQQGRSDLTSVSLTVGDCVVSTAPVVISKVYGGGQSSGGTINADFVELKNRTDGPIDLAGWSVQYASNTGVGGFMEQALLAGTIPAQGYFLVRMSNESSGVPLINPPDIIASPAIAVDNTSGRMLLSRGTSLIGNDTGNADVVDWVGFGSAITFDGAAAAPRMGSTLFIQRKNDGCQDTNQNWNDFTLLDALVFPNNSSSTPVACPIIGNGGCQPADLADDTGAPLPSAGSNTGVNEGDYNAFFAGFFEALSYCDQWDDTGAPLPSAGSNTGVNEGDYNGFFATFFNGCP